MKSFQLHAHHSTLTKKNRMVTTLRNSVDYLIYLVNPTRK